MNGTPIPGSRAPRPFQIPGFIRHPDRVVERAQARHGDVFRLRFEPVPWIVVSHPDAIRDVFTAPPDVALAGVGNEILGPLLGPHSVLTLDEPEHMRQRRLLLPPFHGERMQAQRGLMSEIAERAIGRMPAGRPISLRPHTQEITLDVITRVVFGVTDRGEHDRLARLLASLLAWVGNPRFAMAAAMLGPNGRAMKAIARRRVAPVDVELYRLIRERRAADDLEDRDDVLSMLMLARDEDGTPMSDAELRDELLTLLVAGHETTATALAWAVERLVRHPSALRRLEQEAQTGDTEWAEAVAKETLRLRPVLMFAVRRLVAPLEVGGHLLPAGVNAVPCIHLVHRRPEVYPDPLAFKPERWIGVKPGTYTWIPFGGGMRRCIGASFALVEMEVVLTAFAANLRLKPVGADERPARRFITSSPERGAEVRVSHRAREPEGVLVRS